MRSLLAIIAATASLSTVPAAPVHATPGDGVRRLNFDVYLNDRAIGYQRFELRTAANGLRIDTRAAFSVKLLMVSAFSYDHRNTEMWQGGCLQAMDARTDSDGKLYAVGGRMRGDGFVLATTTGERTLGDCVASLAYWDKDLPLQHQRLLNSQTGEYVPVRVDTLGPDRIRIGPRDVAVDRYALRGQGFDIFLAYAAKGGTWVALAKTLENGRTLRYRRSPGDLDGSPDLRTTQTADSETRR